MTKATDLPPLVAQLLDLKKSAVTPTDLGGDLKDTTETKVGDLRVWFYDSTFPPEMIAQGAPSAPTTGIEVRQGPQMDLVLRIHVGDGQAEAGKLKPTKWKRGPWEQALGGSAHV